MVNLVFGLMNRGHLQHYSAAVFRGIGPDPGLAAERSGPGVHRDLHWKDGAWNAISVYINYVSMNIDM